MRSMIGKVLGVIILLVVVEFGMRGCVNWATSHAVENKTSGVRDVTVASGDIPVVFHFGILGSLSNGSITMHGLVASPINIASLSVSAQNLKISRWQLISGKAKVTESAPYSVRLILSPKNLGDYLNTTVTMQEGYLTGVIDSHPMDVKPRLEGRTIVLKDERYTYKVRLPGTEYLPCTPTGIGVGNGISVSCQSTKLPKILADATG